MSLHLSRLSNAVAAAVEDQGTRGVAEVLGVGKSSVARWSDDLSAWPALALLTLAQQDAQVRTAILGLMTGDAIAVGDSRRACDDVAAALPVVLLEVQRMAAAVADKRVSRSEAREVLAGWDQMEKNLATVKADLIAMLRSGADE